MKFEKLHILMFIMLTIIGTLSHEAGHLIAANYLGYQTVLHYNWSEWGIKDVLGNWVQLQADDKFKFDSLIIAASGPITTMTIGSIGLICLLINFNYKLTRYNTAFVFLSLFWSREVFNLLVVIGSYFFKRNLTLDENKIEAIMQIPENLLVIFFAIAGIYVCTITLYKIPILERKKFVASALIGCPLGLIIWMKLIGPILIP